MQLSNSMLTNKRPEVLKVVLDEPRIYVNDLLGSAMVRGEVITNFPKDIYIQGPIELVFEGIQRYHPWPGEALGSTIETKLQVIELSLLPPNTKGIMPAGVQRFPFEFPIPASLPTTIFIQDRIEIFYQINAVIRRSSRSVSKDQPLDLLNAAHWIDCVRHTALKKKYIATTTLRIVHSLDSVNHLPMIGNSDRQEEVNDQITNPFSWNSEQFDSHLRTFDEHYDHLASSFAGKIASNLDESPDALGSFQGIRYKIGVDRTAVAIGTSIGVEVMVEPTLYDAVVKSVYLTISESKKYVMKVPAKHTWDSNIPKTKRFTEGSNLILKWAHGFPLSTENNCMMQNRDDSKYIYNSIENDMSRYYFETPHPLCRKDMIKRASLITLDSDQSQEFENMSDPSKNELSNLKDLNQPVKLGEYFGGRFIMPVPDCSGILHPSTNHSALQIQHWLQLTVTIECNGKTFDLVLDASSRMLDCRLVAIDDDLQMILPPPPKYELGDSKVYESSYSPKSTFWEQRETITSKASWGSCMPCPCEHKKNKKQEKLCQSLLSKRFRNQSPQKSPTPSFSHQDTLPPSYTNN
ncbi:hypothetical protein A0J61_01573 [Choanephora cucurbitarum]|uniref:Arrestin-like N-terminal domain-containing protein n=1 Tax=Choanephora cucurbitarum TaxID=101091 RepID=A0A1C7NMR7_9FUNG|nr:hypothetical protein A0J61_01573 [Choanephora cucurbitarum]